MVLPNFEENLQKYAHLLVKSGVNVTKGHTVVLQIDVDQAPLARLITKEAYALGASEVIVKWADDVVNREQFIGTPQERLTDIPQYKIDESLDQVAKGASRISV
ncbi:MAG: aminopeptidase, partial [Carnobacterium sp.]|uniref:aminopeptidase n=1 Tax=Carnobacterium sp. TaxID=48221 RepID=UPI0033149684